LAQTFGDWELIVVDDASEDATWAWLQEVNDARVRGIRLEGHSERSKARNAGLGLATGPFILFLDDDDVLPERALRVHVEALNACPAAIASIGGYRVFDERGVRWTVPIVWHRVTRQVWRDVLFGWMAVSGQCLFRTEVVRSANGWSEPCIPVVCEDHDLWLRIGRIGPAVLLTDIVLNYRAHDGQWRPENLEEIMTDVRERAVTTVHGRERQLAERILRVRAAVKNLDLENHGRARGVRAFIRYLGSLSMAPGLLASPLTRRRIIKPMLTFVLGEKGTNAVKQWLRRRLGTFRKNAEQEASMVREGRA
jgi:glycosyltransferase involved in cell wall biosynthesis